VTKTDCLAVVGKTRFGFSVDQKEDGKKRTKNQLGGGGNQREQTQGRGENIRGQKNELRHRPKNNTKTQNRETKNERQKKRSEQSRHGTEDEQKKAEDEQKTTKKRDLLGFLSELQQRNVCCLLSNRFLEPNQQRRRIPGEQKQRKGQRKETQREHERDSRRRKFRKAGKERIKEQRGREARTRTTNGAFLQNLSTRRTPATNVPQLRSSLSHFTF